MTHADALLEVDEAPKEAPQNASSAKQSKGAAKTQAAEQPGSSFSFSSDAPARAPKAERAKKRSRAAPEEIECPGPAASGSAAAAASSSADSSEEPKKDAGGEQPQPSQAQGPMMGAREVSLVQNVAMGLKLEQDLKLAVERAGMAGLRNLQLTREEALVYGSCLSKGYSNYPKRLSIALIEQQNKAALRAQELCNEGDFSGMPFSYSWSLGSPHLQHCVPHPCFISSSWCHVLLSLADVDWLSLYRQGIASHVLLNLP